MAYFNVFVFFTRKIPWVPVSLKLLIQTPFIRHKNVVYQINTQFHTPEERLNVDKQYV